MNSTSERRNHPVVRFLGLGLGIFAIALWLWMRAFPAYLGMLTATCNGILSMAGLYGTVELHPLVVEGKEWIAVYVSSYQQKQTHLFGFGIEILHTHMPVFLALALSTRTRMRSRAMAILTGGIAIHLSSVLFTLLTLAWSFLTVPAYAHSMSMTAPSWVATGVNTLYYAVHLVLIHLVPVLVWAVSCFTPKELSGLLAEPELSRTRR